ncbi:hypothetical protein LOD99_684 [Oopsacas minuta]|uniref:tRNA(Ile)-lysidine synthetase n=1 Tax=Oopsacas minuta TaxID=111878 RepID=A0AAV7JZN4_9METZ|nr:hypothetical protein LOD99_684 [Oopsacas minuta]
MQRLLQAFTSFMTRQAVRPVDHVAVSVSGGCDSLALAFVSQSYFKPNCIHALTIDHQIRPHCSEEAVLVTKILENNNFNLHRCLKIDWHNEQPTTNKIEHRCREERYKLLLDYCNDNNVKILLTAHHLFDQMETVLHRFQMGSSLNGMKGMEPKTTFKTHPNIYILRPFLNETKKSLQEICKEKKVNWVTDYSNFSPLFTRNCLRHILAHNPVLATDISNGIFFLKNFTHETQNQVNEFLRTHLVLEPEYGYYYCPVSTISKLPHPIILRIFTHLSSCLIHGSKHFLKIGAARVYRNLFHPNIEKPIQKTTITSDVIATIDRSSGVISIGKTRCLEKTNIKIGETKLWDNRFEISLKKQDMDTPDSDETYIIRSLSPREQKFVFRAVRRIKATKLPVIHYRFSLPIIVDKADTIVYMPHFFYRDYNVNAVCECKFVPHPRSMHTLRKSKKFERRRKYVADDEFHMDF